jgi:hypothetical protein
MRSFSVVAWNNGRHHSTGAGYGLRIRLPVDRNSYFDRAWKAVELHLPESGDPISISIDNDSFWNGCRELRSTAIGQWLIARALAPWPKGQPPRFKLTFREAAVFEMSRDL